LFAAEALMGLKPGDPAPDFTLTTIEGKVINLAKLRGSITILTFWKRDQEYSDHTLADLERIYQEYQAKGLIILGINADKVQESEIKKIAIAQSISYPLAIDPELKVYGQFGVMVLPTTMIIAPDGRLTYYCPIHPRDFYEKIRGQVRLLLGEITPAQLEAELQPHKLPTESEARKKALRQFKLGRTLLDRGLNDKARQVLEKAAQTDPLFLDPHILLARLYLQAREVDKVFAEVEQALKINPKSKEVRLIQGMAYALRGEDAKALSILEELVTNNPKPLPEAYYQLGKLYQKQNKILQALESYRRALEILLDKEEK
jgi:peroxiredoxin